MAGGEEPGGAQLTFPCTACGATLTYAPGTETLVCEHCGATQAITPTLGEVVEYDFATARTRARRQPAADLVQGGREVECGACGARTVLAGPAGRCPYCDSPLVQEVQATDEVIAPESLLPFAIPRERARSAFESWVKGLWFAPGDLARNALAGRIEGCYLPYWTYDSTTTTDYTGSRGEYYYVTESYTDSQGKSRTRQVRRTRWYPASGRVLVPFDDVLVCASRALPGDLIDSLEPWDLGDLRPYEPAYLSGFLAQRYAVDLEQGFESAKQRMQPPIDRAIRSDIGGDTQQIHTKQTRYHNVKFKHFLLPVWVSSFRYGGKAYQFIVNARTGEVAGHRPYSAWKIALLVVVILAVVGAVAWFASQR